MLGKRLKDNNPLVDRLASLLIPEANAGAEPPKPSQLCISVTGNNEFTAILQNEVEDSDCPDEVYETVGPGKVNGAAVEFDPPCNDPGDKRGISFSNSDVTESKIYIAVSNAGEKEASYDIFGALGGTGEVLRVNSAEDCPIKIPL